MNKTIKVGSRDSALAVIQANIVIDIVKKTNPAINFEIVAIKTTGDKILDKSLDDVGGKGLFIKELEGALADGAIDIAVHSYKDMPYEETDGLPVVALSARDSPFDALVLPQGVAALDNAKPVGCSSMRRAIQFARLYNGVAISPVRGNVPTRLAKLDNGEYSALILAQAGLNRLSLQRRVSRVFTVDEMIPSASQGILAAQGRAGEDYAYLDAFHSRESATVSKAERQFLKTLGGGCSAPVAVYAQLHNNELLLTGMYVDSGGTIETGKLSGDSDQPELLGETLAMRLKERAS
jgi:hydroxymethylbilane synthase